MSGKRKVKTNDGKLRWKHTELASQLATQASSSGPSTTDADFWLGLDADSDDFMGLQEVDGVDVTNEDGRVKFVVQDAATDAQVEEKQEEEEEEEEEHQEEREQEGETPAIDAAAAKSAAKKAKAKQRKAEIKERRKAKVAKAAAAGPSSAGAAGTQADEPCAEFKPVDFSLLAAANDDNDDFDADESLPAWKDFALARSLKQAIHTLGFTKPTTIQAASLPISLTPGRDVVGVAQTGSGKTLAYALPILQYIVDNALDEEHEEAMQLDAEEEEEGVAKPTRPLAALVLCPTRELALQVSKHMSALVDASPTGILGKRYLAGIATLTGGMSEEKQRRILHRGKGADVVVATPGRLWDMCQTDPTLTARIQRTRFLVVDEADRMIESGHFAEMEQILGLVRRLTRARKGKGKAGGKSKQGEAVSAFDAVDENIFAEADAAAAAAAEASLSAGMPVLEGGNSDMQTLIFSATLSKELQRNLKRRTRNRKQKGGSTLEDLMDRIDFRDDEPALVDLTPERRLAAELKETKVECLMKEKDLYLYYFLLRYPGRTIVFINSIDGIRRLLPLLTNLGINAFPLHSQLQQKQRLKHLDRFRSAAIDASAAAKGASSGMASVLLATDVAARGLDVPGIDHVVHYQLPRSADAFVHRSGRTARAGRSGVSVALIEPAEKKLWRDLCHSLSRPDDIPALPVEYSFLPDLRARLEISRSIDNAVHNQSKAAHDESWLKNLASEADIDINSDMSGLDSDVDSGKKQGTSSKAARKARAKVDKLKGDLEELLHKPLSARGVSHKYLTSGSRAGFVQDLLEEAQHDAMIGVKRSTAGDDLDEAKAPRQKKAKITTAAAAHAAATVPVAGEEAEPAARKFKAPKKKKGIWG